ncbi:MAG: hypothetical protein AAF844_21120 [Pseudomonadota bacterium]
MTAFQVGAAGFIIAPSVGGSTTCAKSLASGVSFATSAYQLDDAGAVARAECCPAIHELAALFKQIGAAVRGLGLLPTACASAASLT